MAERQLYVTHMDDLAACKARMEADGLEPYNLSDAASVLLTGERVQIATSRPVIPYDDGWFNLRENPGFLAVMGAPPGEAEHLRAELTESTQRLVEYVAQLKAQASS
jgi:hypothetical protein